MRPIRSQSLLKKAGVRALLLTNPVNVRYITGVEADPGFVLITAKNRTLFVSDLDRESAESIAFSDIDVQN